jgi:hypothetical protein
MAEPILDTQQCPYCNSTRTRYAGTLGSHIVWRCGECARTFWPTTTDSWLIRGIKSLLGAGAQRGLDTPPGA